MRRTWKRASRLTAAAAAASLIMAGVALASGVDESVVDTAAPAGSVTLSAGASAAVTLNLSVTGNQAGTATFDVYRDWTLSGGTFTGSNPRTFTVDARAAQDPATAFSTTGTLTVAAGQVDGTFMLRAGAFNITNTNATGAKLAAGASSSYQVTVSTPAPTDTTAPALTLPPDMTVEATGPAGAVVSFPASALDAVDGPVDVNCRPASGDTLAVGATTVTCTATDSHDNTATGSFTVTVVDTTPPTLTLPADITTTATGNSQAIVNYIATATDLVDGSITPSCGPASGSTFPVGTTAVTCTATDKHDNTTTGSFTVTVNYRWTGFFQPIDNGIVNKAKAGSTIPVKFSLGADQGLGIFYDSSYPRVQTASVSAAATDTIEDYATATVSGLKYDPIAGQYIYNWKTSSTFAGKSYTLVIKLADGSVHTALFTFTK